MASESLEFSHFELLISRSFSVLIVYLQIQNISQIQMQQLIVCFVALFQYLITHFSILDNINGFLIRKMYDFTVLNVLFMLLTTSNANINKP